MEKVVIIILSTERTVSTCEVAGAACRDATRLFESTKVTGAVQPTLEWITRVDYCLGFQWWSRTMQEAFRIFSSNVCYKWWNFINGTNFRTVLHIFVSHLHIINRKFMAAAFHIMVEMFVIRFTPKLRALDQRDFPMKFHFIWKRIITYNSKQVKLLR